MSKVSRFIAISIVLVAFNSCRQSTGPAETATIHGRVELAQVYWLLTPPYSGVTVTLEGTSYSAVTDDSGYFTLRDVPTGTYNVRFSKLGYGDVRWMSTTFTGGGNSDIYWNSPYPQRLYRYSQVVTTLDGLHFVDTTLPSMPRYRYLMATGVALPDPTRPQSESAMAVYLSHTADVSAQPGHYTKFFYASNVYSYASQQITYPTYPIDTAAGRFHFLIAQSELEIAGFHSGDSIYVAAYGAPTYAVQPTEDYYDPILQQYVLTAVNQTPSPVCGTIVP